MINYFCLEKDKRYKRITHYNNKSTIKEVSISTNLLQPNMLPSIITYKNERWYVIHIPVETWNYLYTKFPYKFKTTNFKD